MENRNRSKRKWVKAVCISALSLVIVIAVLCGVCLVFLLDCYRADREAIETFSAADHIEPQRVDNTVVYAPQDATVGFIFYPGAKVEFEAYLPLMEACAAKGILCVITEMPLCFPLIDGDAAEGIPEMYPQIERWYIGGHSLGGYAAAAYVADHTDRYEGLVLLASYSSADLSATELAVLSIYGSEDRIMNRDRYSEGLALLPDDYREVIIAGGCHAYFGMYDGQDGNVRLPVTNEEQLYQTAASIADFMGID